MIIVGKPINKQQDLTNGNPKARVADHASEKCLVVVNQQTSNKILPTENQKLRLLIIRAMHAQW